MPSLRKYYLNPRWSLSFGGALRFFLEMNMKPETKFKRAVKKLITDLGLNVISVDESMSGLDSRTRKAWRTFTLKLDHDVPPSAEILQKLEAINAQSYSGTHAMTELRFDVDMAVRTIRTKTASFCFFQGELKLIS